MPTTMTDSSHLQPAALVRLAVFAILAATQARWHALAVADETTESIPAAVDLRPLFADAGLTVRTQGRRGTCSVFTLVGAMEYALARRDGAGTRLSVEFLNWASNEAIGEHADGGFFSDLWKGYEAFGVCDETEQPYADNFDPHFRPGEAALKQAARRRESGLRLHWIKPWNVTTGLSDAQLAQIKRVLARQWPVCGGFRWPKKERWTDDVLDMAPPEGVRDGHSVLLVGYRDDPAQPGSGAFLIRNSGKGPPHGWMSYEYARTYMNDAAWIDCEASHAAVGRPARARG